MPHKFCDPKTIQVATGCDFTDSAGRINLIDRYLHRLHSTTYYVYANAKESITQTNFWNLAEISDWLDGWVKYSQSDLERFEKEREGISTVLNAKVLGWTDHRMV